MFHDELFQIKEPKTFQVSPVKSALCGDGKWEGVEFESLPRYIQLPSDAVCTHGPLLTICFNLE